MRIVSLVPCITETLVAAGLGDQIVGHTRYCPGGDGVAVVGGVWDPDLDAIAALAPDVVYIDPEEQRPEHIDALEARLSVERISVRSIADSAALAEAFGLPAAPKAAPVGAPIPTVVPIWLRPLRLLGAGRYGDAVLAAAGFSNRVTAPGYPRGPTGCDDVDGLSDLLNGACLLLPTEPWSFGEDDAARYRATHTTLRAVRVVDGRDLFWYGARTRAAIARLRAMRRTLEEVTNP